MPLAAFLPRSRTMVPSLALPKCNQITIGFRGAIAKQENPTLIPQPSTRFSSALFAIAALAIALAGHSAAAAPLPKPRPQSAPAKAVARSGTTATSHPSSHPPQPWVAPIASAPATDIAAWREAITATRRGKTPQAGELQKAISDPVARKLVEWTILRSDETQSIDVSRYMAFITENPSWPSVGLLHRRAEATLWADRLEPAFVRAFFRKETPITTKGKFALARALLLQDDRAGAQSLVREAWRNDSFSSELESQAL